MDMEEIRYLLGSTIFARAKAYLDRVEDLDCETSENGVRHLTADVRGGGRNRYHTQAWLRENGSFVSASCTCPYNENGEGPCCKHIGALLMLDEEGKTQPAAAEPVQKPQLNNIPGVVRGTEFAQESAARKDSYASSLEMLFGKKWRGDEPETDAAARQLLRTYQENTLAELPLPAPEEGQRREFAELEPELTLLSGEQPWLRLRISDGGRQYLVKSIPDLLNAVEQGRVVLRQSADLSAPERGLCPGGTAAIGRAAPPAERAGKSGAKPPEAARLRHSGQEPGGRRHGPERRRAGRAGPSL